MKLGYFGTSHQVSIPVDEEDDELHDAKHEFLLVLTVISILHIVLFTTVIGYILIMEG